MEAEAGRSPSDADPFAAPVDDEVLRSNADIVAWYRRQPDRWQFNMAEQRRQRAERGGYFPASPLSARAETVVIPGPAGDLRLRVIRPQGGGGRGIYCFIHGGGWAIGSYDGQDSMLESIADNSGLVAVSISYRLAPEHPYPAATDDCEAAVLWVAREGLKRLGGDRLTIGGNSVGCQLAVVSMLRLRDRHGIAPFVGANLQAGVFDVRLTPSCRNWGDEPLILNTRDMTMFVKLFLSAGGDPESPDLSPIMADLRDMPAALFTCGTRDPLIDDTLFMAARWRAAGRRADLVIWPGAPHGFTLTATRQAKEGLKRMESFLASI
jgi:acetyl esterase/lipase